MCMTHNSALTGRYCTVTDLWAQVCCREAGDWQSGAGSSWRRRRSAGRSLQPLCRKVRKALMRGLHRSRTIMPGCVEHLGEL